MQDKQEEQEIGSNENKTNEQTTLELEYYKWVLFSPLVEIDEPPYNVLSLLDCTTETKALCYCPFIYSGVDGNRVCNKTVIAISLIPKYL